MNDYSAVEQVFGASKIVERFDLQHNCLTFEEIKWLLRRVKRHSPLYTAILLGITTGMRCAEILSLSLQNISPDFERITYQVLKPRKQTTRSSDDEDDEEPTGGKEIHIKHRIVKLDPWMRQELKTYCDLHFSQTTIEGRPVYVSPWHDQQPNAYGQKITQKIFPWKNTAVFEARWHKYKRIAANETNFDVNRVESMTTYMRDKKRVSCFVWRFHKTRHIAVSIYYLRNNCDIKAAQVWVRHEKTATTERYLHTPDQMGVTRQDLLTLTWAQLLGFEETGKLSGTEAPSQTSLFMYGECNSAYRLSA